MSTDNSGDVRINKNRKIRYLRIKNRLKLKPLNKQKEELIDLIDKEENESSNNKKTLGCFFYENRIKHNISQSQIANKVGLTEATIAKYELDYIKPSNANIKKLIKALHITEKEFEEFLLTDMDLFFLYNSDVSISSFMKDVRVSLGLTVDDAARLLNKNVQYVKLKEVGYRKFSKRVFCEFCNAYSIEPEETFKNFIKMRTDKNSHTYSVLAETIKDARMRKEYTEEELADKLKISVNNLKRYEDGQRAIKNVVLLKKIAINLELRYSQLIDVINTTYPEQDRGFLYFNEEIHIKTYIRNLSKYRYIVKNDGRKIDMVVFMYVLQSIIYSERSSKETENLFLHPPENISELIKHYEEDEKYEKNFPCSINRKIREQLNQDGIDKVKFKEDFGVSLEKFIVTVYSESKRLGYEKIRKLSGYIDIDIMKYEMMDLCRYHPLFFEKENIYEKEMIFITNTKDKFRTELGCISERIFSEAVQKLLSLTTSGYRAAFKLINRKNWE